MSPNRPSPAPDPFAGPDSALSRRLAAVMFTDMAGYTALMQSDESAALRSRKRHREALERSVPDHGGQLLQYFGDGSLSVFGSSVQAVEAAVAIQRELEGQPPLRIGLHVGEIAYDEQGPYGDAINIAARLEALSVPGGVLISDKIFDDIRRHPRLAVVPSGSVRLKNVTKAIDTFSVAVEGVVVPESRYDEDEGIGEDANGSTALPPLVLRRLEARRRQPFLAALTGTFPERVPLIGREREIEALRHRLDDTERRLGGTAFFRGPRGVGKSRLGQEAAEYTRARGWTVLTGRAHPADRLVPLAAFADAFSPVLQGLDEKALAQLVPGGADAIRALFPALGPATGKPSLFDSQTGETQARLFWHFAALVARLAEYRPLLLIIDDLDFADPSSIELFHFLARQLVDKPIFVIGQYTGTDQTRRREISTIEQSLVRMQAGVVFELEPLGPEGTDEFIRRALDIEAQPTTGLSSIVHHWTGGNPFFLIGTLRGLFEARRLRREGGVWVGLDLESLELPHSVSDAVLSWLGTLSEPAVRLARLMAVVGRQVKYEVLAELLGPDADATSVTLDELLRHQIVIDAEEGFTLVYDFRHPLIRETIKAELSLAERRQIHRHIAEGLESIYGDQADEHADELAYHFGQALPGEAGPRAIRYLTTAGYSALSRYANLEAAAYLQEALDRIEARAPSDGDPFEDLSLGRVLTGLSRARRRLGDVPASVALARRVLARARAEGNARSVARSHREIGLSFMSGGDFEEAIEALDQALEQARAVADPSLVIRILLALGHCYHVTGRGEEAEEAVRSALLLADQFEQPDLIARVRGAAMRLHIWTGRLDEVRANAGKALELAHECRDPTVEFWGHWAMATMEGLIGRTGEMARHLETAGALAEQIGSPVLRLELAELEVELAYARGEWAAGLELGGPAIEMARSLGARTILPRLLVWVSLMHLGRGDVETADRLTQEAWTVSGAGESERDRYIDVHTVVPAHIGRAAYHLTKGEWGEAARVAEAALAIADRTGYVVWAIHHVLPLIAEASIHARNLPRAREIGTRLRAEAEAVGHPMGLAWAEACDGILMWLEEGPERGVVGLRNGAEAMEAIPLTYEASRIRRQLAARLLEVGDRAGARQELQRAREVFERLGARPELEKTHEQIRELDAVS